MQTVADLTPVEEPTVEKAVSAEKPTSVAQPEIQYEAHFVSDTIPDNSSVAPSTEFTQTWRLKNPGPYAWPAGCSVRFIGGDNMLNVDMNHPSSLSSLANATESNVMGASVGVHQVVEFSVTMKSPQREGKAISYWRLKTAEGVPFGHKLWCDINVEQPALPVKQEESPVKSEDVESSTMIFPTLDKESPVASIHEATTSNTTESTSKVEVKTETDVHEDDVAHDLESLDIESESDDGFLTDEEYDILDASDEEFFSGAEKK